MEEQDLLDHSEAVQTELQQRFKDDLLLFVRCLIIPSAQGRRLFDSCIQSFQVEGFTALAPSLYAVRDGRMPPIRRFWFERTKKAAKDSDIAACLLWLMAYPVRPVLAQVCAANQKQAGIIKRRASDLLHYNPWLQEHVQIQQNKILNVNRMGEVVIEATDASGGAHGETPDLLILNELVHVARWQAMKDHFNNADGVPRGVVIVSTNAGIKGTQAEVWRKTALASDVEKHKDGRWCVQIWNTPCPWLDKQDVEEARKRDPIGADFARLFRGQWVSGIGGAVTEDVIDRAFRLQGETRKPEVGWLYVAGLDLGISHDHSGVVLLGVNEQEQLIKVCRLRGFVPEVPNDKKVLEVDSEAVERYCLDLFEMFHPRWFGYDPNAGGSFMAQRLRRRGVPMRELSFSSTSNQTAMATAFVTSMNDNKLLCYEDPEGRLRRDFGKFNIRHDPPSKYKLVAVSDDHGHADVGVALVICLPEAISMLGYSLFGPSDSLTDEGGKEWGQEDVEALPDEFKDIYGIEGIELDEEVGIKKRRREGSDGWQDDRT